MEQNDLKLQIPKDDNFLPLNLPSLIKIRDAIYGKANITGTICFLSEELYVKNGRKSLQKVYIQLSSW